jgi:AcrR family transcriptional regulator
MRDRILSVATSLFVERGYDGVAMREISDACGITKAALYYHFTGKAELLSEIFTAYLDEMAVVISAGVEAGGTAEARLRRVVRGLFDVPVERRAILRLAMHDVGSLDAEQRSAFGQAYRKRFIGPLREIIADGTASGEFVAKDPELVVWILLGMVYPFFAPAGGNHPTADPGTVDDLLDVLCHGLAGRE